MMPVDEARQKIEELRGVYGGSVEEGDTTLSGRSVHYLKLLFGDSGPRAGDHDKIVNDFNLRKFDYETITIFGNSVIAEIVLYQ